MTTPDIQQARKWARDNIAGWHFTGSDRALAAARVIQSLPDQWVDAEKVREVIRSVLANTAPGTVGHQVAEDYAALIGELIPAPPLPTLADMTPEERQACLRAQAETWHEVGIIVWVHEATGFAQLITRANGVLERKFKDVTPLPDEPKLEWPGGVEDDCEPATTRPEDVPSGEAWLIAYEGGFHTALKADDGDDGEPWIVSFTPGGAFLWLSDRDVTLISRLVPERKENA